MDEENLRACLSQSFVAQVADVRQLMRLVKPGTRESARLVYRVRHLAATLGDESLKEEVERFYKECLIAGKMYTQIK